MTCILGYICILVVAVILVILTYKGIKKVIGWVNNIKNMEKEIKLLIDDIYGKQTSNNYWSLYDLREGGIKEKIFKLENKVDTDIKNVKSLIVEKKSPKRSKK